MHSLLFSVLHLQAPRGELELLRRLANRLDSDDPTRDALVLVHINTRLNARAHFDLNVDFVGLETTAGELTAQLRYAMSARQLEASLESLQDRGLIRVVRRKLPSEEPKLLIEFRPEGLERYGIACSHRVGNIIDHLGTIEFVGSTDSQVPIDTVHGEQGEPFKLPPGITL